MIPDLEPAPLWTYFQRLCAIPRPSGGEAAAARWVADEARALGCEVEQDEVGNVLIRKRATPGREDRPAVAMQCHVDMVTEKNETTAHDFTRDPIVPRRVGDHLYATGTTLGADNGIGVATALAVLASTDIPHPAIEVLVTVDEESGLTGVNHLRGGWMRAPRLLNLDSEEEGELTIGCAGGVDTTAVRRVTDVPAPAGVALRVKVAGLKGGHSGVDIEHGRANSLRLLGVALERAMRVHGAAVATLAGGNKRNAIPREASAVIVCPAAAVDALRADVERVGADARLAFGAFDPGIELTVTQVADVATVLADADARAVVGLLLAGPHGVEAMSPDIPGLVQTSTNMGVLEREGDEVSINFLTRSSVDSSKRALAARVAAVAGMCGFTTSDSGDYPGWKPEPGSQIVALLQAVHTDVVGKPMLVKAIHAGLECGLIRERYPDMEMASIGPSMWDVHTPDEHVSISSVARFWSLLVAVLGRM